MACEEVRVTAAETVSLLARHVGHLPKLMAAGVVPRILAMLAAGQDSKLTRTGCDAVRALARNDELKSSLNQLGAIPPLVTLVKFGRESPVAVAATAALRNLAASKENQDAIAAHPGALE
eukprot:5294370-Prymnesium_polylepis.1